MSISSIQNQDLGLISYLRSREIGRPSQGAKLWRKLAENNDLEIRSFLENAAHARNYTADSESQVFERIRRFASTIPDNQKGSFTCVFLSSPQCYLHVDFGYGNFDYNKRSDIEEVYVLTQKLFDDIINEDYGASLNNPRNNQSLASFRYALPDSGEFEHSETLGKIICILLERGESTEH